ncbi:hypothetical protein [Maribacter sp. HTCC2170]|uniref:hypothetical protein n=1 Tax=Maribacter sp. (strain HTCC2170 / KCCM 42371) TaxID=313603 RepID=UPI00006AFD63|nr:hypothetical protein [Maribacter sp. HTCC2170]EAR01146.1 hypothetical protein FB2170_10516 [Maribacter sp. HTCC2170]
MNRKTFIQKSVGALLIAVPAVSMLSCSSSDDGVDEPPKQNANADCLANGTSISIGSNHGHSLTVSKADVNAGVAKTYSIQGTSGHGHTINLTAANFTSLKANSSISITSTNDNDHTHAVQVSCA